MREVLNAPKAKGDIRNTKVTPRPHPGRALEPDSPEHGWLPQAKLTVGSPDDPLEREADRMADRVMRMGSTRTDAQQPQGISTRTSAREPTEIRRKCESCRGEEEVIRAKEEAGQSPTPSVRFNRSRDLFPDSGRPMSPELRDFYEPRFGRNLEHVRLHTGEESARAAREMHARAFTLGSDIGFGAGQFQPVTDTGRRLLGHELAHVVQQTAESPRIQRSYVEEEEGFFEEVVDFFSEEEEVDQPFTPNTAHDSAMVGLEREPVRRVFVSSQNHTITFETREAVYIYELDTCETPDGIYSATVQVTGDDIRWTFGTTDSPEEFVEQLSLHYRVRSDQVNPARLFGSQRSVLFIVAENAQSVGEGEGGCLFNLAPRELIALDDTFNRPIFEPQELEPTTIWSIHGLPLGEFGWVDIDAMVSGHASSEFSGSYGPGTLQDICLAHRLRGGRWAGRARFHFPAQLNASILLEGDLSLEGEYLSVFNLAALRCDLEALGHADSTTEFNGEVEFIYDPSAENPWQFLSRNELRADAQLGFTLDARLAFEALGIPIWSATWNLANGEVGVAWQGGLNIGTDQGIEFQSGQLEFQNSSEVTASGAGDGGQGSQGGQSGGFGSGSGSSGDRIEDTLWRILRLLLAYDDAEIITDDGQQICVPGCSTFHYPRRRAGDRYEAPPDAIPEPGLVRNALDWRLENTDLEYESFKRNVAVFKVTINGEEEFVTAGNLPGSPMHSETMVARELRDRAQNERLDGVRIEQVYTERCPCANCARDLQSLRSLVGYDFPIFFTVPTDITGRLRARTLQGIYYCRPWGR